MKALAWRPASGWNQTRPTDIDRWGRSGIARRDPGEVAEGIGVMALTFPGHGWLATPRGLLAPYCGAPPTPDDWPWRWNLDPRLIAALLGAGALYAACAWAGKGERGWRRASFGAGWAVAALALISPLCALSVSLFSARVGQHMILATVAAPLLALGRPERMLTAGWARLLGRTAPADVSVGRPLAAALAFAAALWIWHAPGPYAATFESDLTYWGMHLTTFGAALWFWMAVLNRRAEHVGAGVAAILFTTGQMGLLGAIITFAPTPLYWPHAFTTGQWGLSPLEDQQLGGVIMWVPAGAILAGALVFAFAAAMRRPAAGSAFPSAA